MYVSLDQGVELMLEDLRRALVDSRVDDHEPFMDSQGNLWLRKKGEWMGLPPSVLDEGYQDVVINYNYKPPAVLSSAPPPRQPADIIKEACDTSDGVPIGSRGSVCYFCGRVREITLKLKGHGAQACQPCILEHLQAA